MLVPVGVGIIIVVAFAWEAISSQREDVPRIVFDATTVDFGEKLDGDEAQCTFLFENRGTAPLLLRGVRVSCGCIKAKLSAVEIAPGARGELVTFYDTLGRSGDVKSTVLLFTNDSEASPVPLTITGAITKSYIWQPHVIDFGRVRWQEPARKTVAITRLAPWRMQITDVETSVPWLKGAVVSESEGALIGGQLTTDYEITVELSPSAPIGQFAENIVVNLLTESSRPIRQITIPTAGSVVGELTYEPAVISWGTVEPGQRPEAYITIESNTGGPMTIENVSCRNGSVEIVDVTKGNATVRILVRLQKNPASSLVADTIVITTPSRGMPLIEIPVYARIRTTQS